MLSRCYRVPQQRPPARKAVVIGTEKGRSGAMLHAFRRYLHKRHALFWPHSARVCLNKSIAYSGPRPAHVVTRSGLSCAIALPWDCLVKILSGAAVALILISIRSLLDIFGHYEQ